MEKYDAIRSILDSLRRLVRELRVSSRQAEARSGLTAAQLFVLERVAANQPVSVNTLAELTLTHQSSVSVVAQRLVQRGFLEQRLAPEDRRRKELTITAQGRKALRWAPNSVQDRLIKAASTMGVQDQRDLSELLGALIVAIGLQDSEPVLFFEKEHHGQETHAGRKSPAASTKNKESK
jgi:DNA-binding MarR family transcriptional regulator